MIDLLRKLIPGPIRRTLRRGDQKARGLAAYEKARDGAAYGLGLAGYGLARMRVIFGAEPHHSMK
jgi:hypothetical protein